jgi:uncharacterized membrane protein (UPF0127 family)
MRRRELVGAIGAGSVGVLAGCVGSGPTASDGDGGGTEDDANTGNDTTDENDATDENDTTDGDGANDGEGPTGDWPSGTYADYDATDVEARTADGDLLGTVTAAIAESGDQRYLGLSDAESLPQDAGMLFVFPSPRESLTLVMREMGFGIDIVYADSGGTIVEIHSAPAPGPNEDGSEQTYPGSGQYVLEVPYEWTDRHDVEVGDSLAFEL